MKRLKLKRLERGWSQQELGFLAGVQAPDISKMETGRLRPYPDQSDRLARVLEIHSETLLDEVPDELDCGSQSARQLKQQSDGSTAHYGNESSEHNKIIPKENNEHDIQST